MPASTWSATASSAARRASVRAASTSVAATLAFEIFRPKFRAINKLDLRRTRNFKLTACAGAVATTGGGHFGAVIAEADMPKPLHAKYEVSFEGLSGGFSISNTSTSTFQATVVSSVNDFSGGGNMGSLGAGAAYVVSASAGWQQLSDDSYAPSPPSINLGVDKARSGVSGVLAATQWDLKIRSSLDQTSELCATNTF